MSHIETQGTTPREEDRELDIELTDEEIVLYGNGLVKGYIEGLLGNSDAYLRAYFKTHHDLSPVGEKPRMHGELSSGDTTFSTDESEFDYTVRFHIDQNRMHLVFSRSEKVHDGRPIHQTLDVHVRRPEEQHGFQPPGRIRYESGHGEYRKGQHVVLVNTDTGVSRGIGLLTSAAKDLGVMMPIELIPQVHR